MSDITQRCISIGALSCHIFGTERGLDFTACVLGKPLVCYIVRFNGFVQVPKIAQY